MEKMACGEKVKHPTHPSQFRASWSCILVQQNNRRLLIFPMLHQVWLWDIIWHFIWHSVCRKSTGVYMTQAVICRLVGSLTRVVQRSDNFLITRNGRNWCCLTWRVKLAGTKTSFCASAIATSKNWDGVLFRWEKGAELFLLLLLTLLSVILLSVLLTLLLHLRPVS